MENQLQIFKTIEHLIENLPNLQENEWIYVNISQWQINPLQTIFYSISESYIENLMDEEIYEDDEGLEMPLSVQHLDLQAWMVVSDLAFIFDKNQQNINEFINEINYYREFDSYL